MADTKKTTKDKKKTTIMESGVLGLSTDNKKGMGLLIKLLGVVLVPIVIITVFCIIGINDTGNKTASRLMNHELEAVANSIKTLMEAVDDGDYRSVGINFYKGNYNYTENSDMLDNLSKKMEVDITMFWGDTRLYTTIRNPQGERAVGTKADQGIYKKVMDGNTYFSDSVMIQGNEYSSYYMPLENKDGSRVGMLFVGMKTQVAESVYNKILTRNVIILIVSIIVITALVAYIVLKIIKGIKMVVTNLDQVAEGDLGITVHSKLMTRNDEIGNIARAVDSVVVGFAQIVRNIHTSTDELNVFSDKFKANFGKIAESISNIDVAIGEIANGATNQAGDTQKVNDQVELIGSAINDMNNGVKSLGESAATMREKNEDANRNLKDLIEISDLTKKSVDEVQKQTLVTNQSALDIRSATDIISDIASQTNLLSLNASIEAARAGENGRGFAVVADEIRILADQSTESAEKIKKIIETLIANSNTSVNIMNEVTEEIKHQNEKLDSTRKVFDVLNKEIDNVTVEIDGIAGKIDNINQFKNSVVDGMTNLSAIAEENAASTQETSASMVELSQIVNDCDQDTAKLVELSQSLQDNTKKFKMKG